MNFYVDITRDKVQVRSAYGSDVPRGWVQFDNDPKIDLPEGVDEVIRGYYLIANYVRSRNQHYAIAVGSNDHAKHSYLVCKETREVKTFPLGCGMWPVWVTESGIVACTTCYPNYRYFDIDGNQTRDALIPGEGRTSQGFNVVNDDGSNIFTFLDGGGEFEKDGIKLLRFRRDGNWGAGGLSGGGDETVAYNFLEDKFYLVSTVYTPVGNTIKQHEDGSCTVAISLPKDKKSYFTHSSQFTKFDVTKVYTVQKYVRKMFCAPYDSFTLAYGATDMFVGNVAFPSWQTIKEVPKELPLMLGNDTPLDIVREYENRCLYYYAHNDQTAYENILNNWPWKGTIYYKDSRTWWSARPSWMNKDRTILGVQWYRNQNESVAQFRSALITMMDSIKNYELPFAASLMFYDRGGWFTEAQILECIPVYEELMDKYQVMGIMPFSDMRPNGMIKYPALKEALKKMYNAIPVRPNRLDYWSTGTNEDLARKLLYEMVVLTKSERNKLIGLLVPPA